MRGRLKAWRYRLGLYSRRRWTDPEINEVEAAVMGACVLVAIIALLVVMGRNG